MTSTVLRVKRRLEENPQDALVLLCKRMKTDENEEISPSLFIFRGTVDNPGNIYAKVLVPRSEPKRNVIPKVDDIIEKLRKERKEATTESRYEIVNASRGLNEFVQRDDVYNFVDIEPKMVDMDQDTEYTYDLYTSAFQHFDVTSLDQLVSIENYMTDLVYGSICDNGQPTSEEESEDSNDENHWRNEYPDSDKSSITEEDMIRAVARVDLGDDLSSDDDEDQIYTNPSSDLFKEDAKKYGASYAKYKARVLAENPDLKDDKGLIQFSKVKDIDEESVEGYKEDSDDGFYYGQDEDTQQDRDQYKHESTDEFSPD